MNRFVWLAPLAGLLLACGCQQKAETDLLASVGAREIRVPDLLREAERQRFLGAQPLDKAALLEEMIQRAVLVERALQLGLDHEPEMRRSYENLLIAKLKQRELEPSLRQLEVSGADLQAHAAKSSPVPVLKSQLAVLHLRAHPRMSPQKTAQLQARLEEARSKAAHLPPNIPGFGELAIDYSEDQATRYTGGDAGWFEHDPEKYHLPPEVLLAGFRLRQPSDVSDVIHTKSGFYLVKVMARSAAEENVSDASRRHSLLLQKQRAAKAQFAADAKAAVRVKTYPAILNTVKLDPTKTLTSQSVRGLF